MGSVLNPKKKDHTCSCFLLLLLPACLCTLAVGSAFAHQNTRLMGSASSGRWRRLSEQPVMVWLHQHKETLLGAALSSVWLWSVTQQTQGAWHWCRRVAGCFCKPWSRSVQVPLNGSGSEESPAPTTAVGLPLGCPAISKAGGVRRQWGCWSGSGCWSADGYPVKGHHGQHRLK